MVNFDLICLYTHDNSLGLFSFINNKSFFMYPNQHITKSHSWINRNDHFDCNRQNKMLEFILYLK